MLRRLTTSRGRDGTIAVVLFVASLMIAGWYVPHFVTSGGKPWFYQEEFGPAVMMACGHGYVNPDTAMLPHLDEFLHRTRDAFSCSDLGAVKTLPIRSMQRAFRYLISTVGWTWRIEGHVAWSALTPLYALLYGITVVLVFAIFRQGMGSIAAGLCAGAIAVSTLNLNNLPHLRDYGKAPFVLALVLIAVRLVVPVFATRRTLWLACVAGLLTGIGVGFRNDLLVAIPAFVAVFAVFLPVSVRERVAVRISAISIYGGSVLLAMYPMWSTYTTGGGNSSQHLVLLGLTPAFSRDLGVDNSRLYEWGFEYRDELALAMIDNYADRRLGEHTFLPMYGPAYDRAGARYLFEIATTFPADMLARVYASAVGVLNLPHSTTTSALMPPAFVSEPVLRLYEARTWLLRRLAPLWPWTIAVTFLALSLASVRLGLFAALFVLYLSGYPALQFQERHFFHLEFVGWFALGFTASLASRSLGVLSNHARRATFPDDMRPAGGWWRATGMAVALWCALGVAVVGPLWVLRAYQQDHVHRLLHAIVDAPRADLAAVRVPAANGGVRFESSSLTQGLPPDDGVHAAYVVAELGGASCDALKLELTERYTATSRPYDFTHTVTVPTPLSDSPVQVFFPAYFRRPQSTDLAQDRFAFAGLELPGAAADCLIRLSRVQDPSQIPLLLDVQLRPHWEEVTPYATIAGVESRVNPPEVYTFPADLPRSVVKRSLMATPVPFQPADIRKVSKTFHMLEREWRVDGAGGVGGRGPLLYLVEMQPRHLDKDSFFIAEGRLDKGGVTFGLVHGDEWTTQMQVVQTGAFTVVIKVPTDGEYKVVLANNLLGMSSLTNRLVVTRAGLVAAAAAGAGR
jgi:hypothetical protein